MKQIELQDMTRKQNRTKYLPKRKRRLRNWIKAREHQPLQESKGTTSFFYIAIKYQDMTRKQGKTKTFL